MTAARRAIARPDLTIVKLGGSLAGGAAPTAWLDALATAAGRVVLVPGGGPFADPLRALQARWGLSDAAAHRLAIQAMELYGSLLAELHPGLVPAASRTTIRAALRRGQVPVWMPLRMALADPAIPQSWDVTSDSLALWLGKALGAARVVLVKSAPPPGGPVAAAALAESGHLDAAFPDFLANSGLEARCLGPEDGEVLVRLLADHPEAGTPILP